MRWLTLPAMNGRGTGHRGRKPNLAARPCTCFSADSNSPRSRMPTTLRTETADGVRSIVLSRDAEYNTITPALRDELAAAIDAADADDAVRVILLRADGPAFCAGYGLDWSTAGQAEEQA